MSHSPLCGHRILVVEDCAIQADEYADMLKGAGAEVVGPAGDLAAARKLAASESNISAALLDVQLGDDNTRIWPVATELARRGVPFLFCTAHPKDVDPVAWAGHPVLSKGSLVPESVLGVLAELIRKRGSRTRSA